MPCVYVIEFSYDMDLRSVMDAPPRPWCDVAGSHARVACGHSGTDSLESREMLGMAVVQKWRW